MDKFINFILIIGIFALAFYILYRYRKTSDAIDSEDNDMDISVEDNYDIDIITREVSNAFNSILKTNIREQNLTRKQAAEYEAKKAKIKTSLKTSAFGDQKAKQLVRSYSRDIVTSEGYFNVNKTTIDKIIPFEKEPEEMSGNDKFLIMGCIFLREFKQKGITKLLDDYGLSTKYKITSEDLDPVYEDVLKKYPLSYSQKMDILTQKIFQNYKGFGAADILFDSDIDEVEGGVSGIPKNGITVNTTERNLPFSYQSIWIIVHGRKIYMKCLDFGSQAELERVCENLYKFNPQREFSRQNGYVVTTMYNGSRVVCVRPDFADSFAFLVRKFDSAPSVDPAILIAKKDSPISSTETEVINQSAFKDDEYGYFDFINKAAKATYEDSRALFLGFIKWMIIGQRNIIITGEQGTGKSTFLKGILRYIPQGLSWRIQELAFELSARYAYPETNILTFQQTDNISAQDGINLQKKTSGDVNIIGEISNDVQAEHYVQTTKVASLFGLATHHGKTTKETVEAIADNLLSLGLYNNKKDATSVVSQAINIDIHLENTKGFRHPERITEIIYDTDSNYPTDWNDEEDPVYTLEDDIKEYFKRTTDRKQFYPQDIFRYIDDEYVVISMPSEKLIQNIRSKLTKEDEKEFDILLEAMRQCIEKRSMQEGA